MKITSSAKYHTSIVLFAWWTDMKNVIPSREPEKDITRMREGDEFRDEG